MGKLFCLPLGQTIQNRFLLDCTSHGYKYNQALFILPSMRLVTQAKEETLVQVGNFDFVAKCILKSAKITINNISPTAQQLIIGGFLQGLHTRKALNFFAGFSDSSGLIKALVTFFTELARAGIEPEDFLQTLAVFSQSENLRAKDRELTTIYFAYKNFLDERNLFDVQSIYLRAIKVLKDEDFVLPWQKVYVSEFYRFDALQLEMLKLLDKRCDVKIALVYQPIESDVYEATRKAYEDLMGCGFSKEFVEIEKVQEDHLQAISQRLFKTEIDCVPANEKIKIYKYANRRQEMQEVVADIKQKLLSGVKLDDIILVTRNITLYPGLRREFLIAGVPVCLPDSVNLFIQPLLKLPLAVLQIVSGDVRQGLNSLFSVFIVKECLQVDTEAIKKIFTEEFFSTLTEGKNILQRKLSEEDVTTVEDFLTLLENCPQKATAKKFGDFLSSFLEKIDITSCIGGLYKNGLIMQEELKLIAKTYEQILLILAEITRDYETADEENKEITVSSYKALLESYVKERVFVEDRGEDYGVRIALASEVSGFTYHYVYIIGLKEGEFPRFENEHWLYNDEERKQLSTLGFLTDTNRILAQDRYFFASCIAIAQKEVWLSASLTDNELLSSHIDEVLRVCSDVEIVTRDANRVLPAKEKIMSQEILACYLTKKTTKQNLTDEKAIIWLNNYLGEDFALRHKIDLPLRSPLYNGKVLQPEVLALLKEKFAMVFNPSSLENYAFCPFKFLVEYVWQLRDWQVANEFIRADFRGNIYHDCLRSFLRKYLGKPLLIEHKKDLAKQLTDIFDDTVDSYIKRGRLPVTYLTEQECITMHEHLQTWLKAELSYQMSNKEVFAPACLEWQFGNIEKISEEMQDTHLIFDTKEGQAKIRGRIDRIDKSGDEYFITDYKLKGTPRKIDIDKGVDLQMPIYLLAVDQFLGKALGGNYFSVENGKRDGGFWTKEAEGKIGFVGRIGKKQKEMPDDWQEYKNFFQKRIVQLVENICTGDFMPEPANNCPDYCSGKGVCRFIQKDAQKGEVDA